MSPKKTSGCLLLPEQFPVTARHPDCGSRGAVAVPGDPKTIWRLAHRRRCGCHSRL